MTEYNIVGWHHRLNGHEFEQALGDDEGQGSLVCCSPWDCKGSDKTEQLNTHTGPLEVIWASLVAQTVKRLPTMRETWIQSMAAAAKSLQSCPTLCDPIDGSPPCSPVPGILQARTLEWAAISFSSA